VREFGHPNGHRAKAHDFKIKLCCVFLDLQIGNWQMKMAEFSYDIPASTGHNSGLWIISCRIVFRLLVDIWICLIIIL
jgi:hypothetical protein